MSDKETIDQLLELAQSIVVAVTNLESQRIRQQGDLKATTISDRFEESEEP